VCRSVHGIRNRTFATLDHSDTGFVGGFFSFNSGLVSNEGSTIGQTVTSDMKGREALIGTFWNSFEDYERSHRSDTFQPLLTKGT
jgi:hypothetical protein